MLAQIGSVCQHAYGFKPGTDGYSQCVFQIDQNRIASNREQLHRISKSLSDTGDSMMQSATANRPRMCTSTPLAGGGFMTSCI